MTARELAERLEVSERTVLRDIDVLSGSGVPVYAVRGPGGGFALLDTFDHSFPPVASHLTAGDGRIRRVRVRLAPNALQVAQLSGRPDGWRARPTAAAPDDRPDWVEGSFRYTSPEVVLRDLAALGADVEVLLPVELRRAMADFASTLAARHR